MEKEVTWSFLNNIDGSFCLYRYVIVMSHRKDNDEKYAKQGAYGTGGMGKVKPSIQSKAMVTVY